MPGYTPSFFRRNKNCLSKKNKGTIQGRDEMKALLAAVAASYLVTRIAGIVITRRTAVRAVAGRRIRLGLSLVTCALLTVYFHLAMFN